MLIFSHGTVTGTKLWINVVSHGKFLTSAFEFNKNYMHLPKKMLQISIFKLFDTVLSVSSMSFGSAFRRKSKILA